jgi:RimJ/RimL family protein N-acetyltransferase
MTVAVSLRTARLLLRPWRDEDVAAFGELNADTAVMEYLSVLPDWPERARAHWEEHGFGQWVVEIPNISGFIGVVGLNTISYPAHFTPAVEVAWRLAQAHWGRGYATEAAHAALNYGFDQLGLTEIVATTVPANWRSRRVMERLGMTRAPEDDFDHPRVADGPLKRHVLYRLRTPSAGTS